MDYQYNQKDNLNDLINKYNIQKKEFTLPPLYIDSYNQDNVIQNINYDLICPICINIIKDPKSCSLNCISHSFCKNCIDIYLVNNDKCPICKNQFGYKDNPGVLKSLNKLSFRCMFHKEGCNKILIYSEYINHINECKYNKLIYECQVEKLNNSEKIFTECKFRGYKKKIKEHLKLCAFYRFKCFFCNKIILNINLKDHIEKECKIGIISYKNQEKYIGEKNIKTREGYGIYYFLNGSKYEGDWKNGKMEGYGIFSFSNGEKYEGEFNNYKKEGYGIYYYSNGNKYEGEWKNNTIEGYGINYYSNGNKYEGEWKNNKIDGFGIYY